MKTRLKPLCVLIFVLAIVLFAVSLISIHFHSAKTFFAINISNIISIGVTIVFSFILVQNLTDERKQREVVDNIIMDLKTSLSDNKYYIITGETDKDSLLDSIRVLANNVDYLSNVNSKFINQNDVTYIKDIFEEYRNLIGDHITDLSYLSKSKKELERKINLIDSKLTNMRLEIYGMKKQ